MDFKDLANKAKEAVSKNPELIEKAGDMLDQQTGHKFSGQIDGAENAARKWVGAEEQDKRGGGE